MNLVLGRSKSSRMLAVTALLLTLITFGLTACAPLVCVAGSWGGGDTMCKRMMQSEGDAEEQQSQRELPALQKRADAGDVKAQFAMGQFHVLEYHSGNSTNVTGFRPNADRAIGLAYYYKAGLQGDLQAQRIFATETLYDCRANAVKMRKAGTVTPSNLPKCVAYWIEIDMLAKNLCVC